MDDKAKTFELIYSQQATDYIEGRAYSNPRFFTSARTGVTKVFIVGDWPEIVAAYEAQGVPVERLDAAQAMGAPADPAVQAAASRVVPNTNLEERTRVYIPEDWRALSWTKATDAGLTLRSLGAIFSDAPVLNKKQATEAVEAELSRRAELVAAYGLTRPEIEADLIAMDVDFEPKLDDAALLSIRNAARTERES